MPKKPKSRNGRGAGSNDLQRFVARPPRPITTATSGTAPVYAPDFIRRRLRYTESRAITTSTGTLGPYNFVANGLYDPNSTGTGHQPMSFDQHMALYTLYHVLACRVTLDIYNVSDIPAVVGVGFSMITSPYATYTDAIEAGQCVYRVVPGSLSVPVRISTTLNIPQFVGKRDLIDDQQYAGTIAANPAVPVYASVFVQDQNMSSVSVVQVLVTLEFDVVFNTPRSLTQS